MPNDSMIPRPPSVRDIRRNQEDEARRREQQTNSRKSGNTTVSRGGNFNVDGNFNVRNGGISTVERGGKMNVQGSVDITDDGEATVTGQGPEWYGGDTVPIVTCLGNRTAWNPWIGYNYTQPGVYFTKGESMGALDPRVISEDGDEVLILSASELLQYGPQVGPNIKSDSSLAIRPGSASIGSGSWDQSVNYEGREGLEGLRGSSYGYFTPSEFSIGLDNYEYLGTIPQGPVARIEASLENRKLRLSGMDGVDIKGPFTVDGAPVGGAPEWSAVKNKPSTFPPSTHGHNNATQSAPGFMSPTDKGKLDGSTANPTPNTVMYRDAWGRAQIGDPVGVDDVATKRYVDAASVKTRIGHYVTTGSKGNAVVENQAIATLAYVGGGSTDNVATPGAGRLTITETGIYSIACTIRLYAEAALINPKPMTGRSFIDITDTAGDALARQAIPVAEDQATAPHPGVLLKAGDVVQFWLYQTSGGTAYYRARIWLTKNP